MEKEVHLQRSGKSPNTWSATLKVPTNSNGFVSIRIKPNERKVKEREKLAEPNPTHYPSKSTALKLDLSPSS